MIKIPGDIVTNGFRNRLIGSLIVVVAGIIIIPSILDGEKQSYKDDFKTVPAAPEFRSVDTSQTFPDKSFEQRLPQDINQDNQQAVVDIDPAEAEAARQLQLQQAAQANAAKVAKAANDSKVVLENDTVAVLTVTKPLDFDQPLVEPNKTPAPAPRPEPVSAKPVVADPPVTEKKPQDSRFAANAWVIQLGVFSQKSNADALEKKLNDAGFTTFSRPMFNNNQNMTKVFVGPELNRKVLEDAVEQVKKLAGINGELSIYAIKE